MAVYKATYCTPYLTPLDVASVSASNSVLYLRCHVDTSNKNVTGYSIVLRDENNKIVFPVGGTKNFIISPVSALNPAEWF